MLRAVYLLEPFAAGDRRRPWWYAGGMEEFGLAILVVGALLVVERDRLEWVTGKVRDLIEWLAS